MTAEKKVRIAEALPGDDIQTSDHQSFDMLVRVKDLHTDDLEGCLDGSDDRNYRNKHDGSEGRARVETES